MLNTEKLINYLPNNLSQEVIDNINKLEFLPVKQRYNIIGKKFNRLLVLGKGPSIQTSSKTFGQWWCLCDCGNIILVRHNNLTSNNTKSCGCLNNEIRKNNIKKATEKTKLDLSNKKFGKLLALKPTNERKNNSIIWECVCDCGRIHKVSASALNSHRVESCGCLSFISKGNLKIKEILQNSSIDFIQEKTFETCKFLDSNAYARFDFYINNEFLLEFDGIQHYKEQDNYFKDSLQKIQEHDSFKNEWCKKNNIPLKRIPYTEIDNITLENIMGDKYLIL